MTIVSPFPLGVTNGFINACLLQSCFKFSPRLFSASRGTKAFPCTSASSAGVGRAKKKKGDLMVSPETRGFLYLVHCDGLWPPLPPPNPPTPTLPPPSTRREHYMMFTSGSCDAAASDCCHLKILKTFSTMSSVQVWGRSPAAVCFRYLTGRQFKWFGFFLLSRCPQTLFFFSRNGTTIISWHFSCK